MLLNHLIDENSIDIDKQDVNFIGRLINGQPFASDNERSKIHGLIYFSQNGCLT